MLNLGTIVSECSHANCLFDGAVVHGFIDMFSFLFPANYKPIKAELVASKMNVYSKLSLTGNHIISNKELLKED